MPGTCATDPIAAPTMTKVAAAIEKRKFIPSSMNQNCRTMMIQTRTECAITSPKLRPRSRNDKPCDGYVADDAFHIRSEKKQDDQNGNRAGNHHPCRVFHERHRVFGRRRDLDQ